MIRRPLFHAPGEELRLGDRIFTLDPSRPVGRGGTCLVYHAFQQDPVVSEEPGNGSISRRVILKEFYPRIPDCGNWRREDGSLVLPWEDPQLLLRQERFLRSRQLFVRLHNEDSLNLSMAEAQACFWANGTLYTVMDYGSGLSLEDLSQDPDLSLWALLSTVRNLALVLSRLHALGYLHLDLKPDNILCHTDDGTQHLVRLIDTDSFVTLKELEQGTAWLSGSQGYTAPEVLLCGKYPRDHRSRKRLLKYAPRADIYSLGAVLHQCLFGHEPQYRKLPRAEQLADLLRQRYPDIPRKAALLLARLLGSLLEPTALRRCESMAQVFRQLDLILPLVSPREIRIAENFSGNPYPVVGREEQLQRMRSLLTGQNSSSRTLCVTGLGGLGKSTLARLYAECYGEDYDTVSEVSASSAAEAIRQIRIHNWEPDRDLSEEDRTAQITAQVAALARVHPLLLIVNNYDVSTDPGFSRWNSLGCDIILTSRHDWSGSGIPCIPLACGDLSREAAAEIFTHYYLADIGEDARREQLRQQLEQEAPQLQQLLTRLDRHPLGIKLTARYMAAVPGRELLPSQALEQLDREGFSRGSPVTFQNERDRDILEENVYGHLAFLFRSSLTSGVLTDQELTALRYLQLTCPHRGISAGRFAQWTGLHAFLPEKLRKHGWLEYCPNRQDLLDPEPHRGVYQLPTVIREVLGKEPEMACVSSEREPFPKNNNCIPFLARAANFSLERLDSYEARYALCQEQKFLLKQMEGQKSELLAGLLHTTAVNLMLLNPRLVADPNILVYLNECQAMLQELELKNHWLSVSCKISVGSVLYSWGKTRQALIYFLQAKAEEESRPDPDPWRLAEASLFLGKLHWECGNLEKGISRIKEALSILEKKDSSHTGGIIACLLLLGEYLRITGQLEQAERCLLRAEDLCAHHFRSTHFQRIPVHTQLADLYLDREDPDRAIHHLNQVLELSKQLYGEKNLSYNVTIMSRLADAWAAKGNRKEAIFWRETLLSIYRANDSKNRSFAAEYVYGTLDSSPLNFSRLHRLSGKPDPDDTDRILAQHLLHLSLDYVSIDAEKVTQYLQGAVAAFNALLGSYTVSPDEYTELYRLYYRRAGQLLGRSQGPEAFAVLEDWFQICRRLYGNGPETAMEAMCLAAVYARLRCPEKAKLYRRHFRSIRPGTWLRLLGQWLTRDHSRNSKKHLSEFHDQWHFGAFCQLLGSITHQKRSRRKARLRAKVTIWRRLLQKRKYIREHPAPPKN